MAKIFPFRAVRYDTGVVDDISKVVAQPYDRIGTELQEKYYDLHPKNVVRIIKGKTCPDDNSDSNQYTRARDYLDSWLSEGTLVKDAGPAIYLYDQTYTVGDVTRTRRGFVALGELEELGKGVKPHERTLAGPKADRLNLMRAAAAQFGQIFMLYSDQENRINKLLGDAASGPPDYDAPDIDGVRQRVWVLRDPALHGEVAKLMENKFLFIADGHHRYETAVNYRNEMRAAGKKCAPGSESFDNRMMTFVNMADEGLTILPTHRLVHSVDHAKSRGLLEGLAEHFEVVPLEGGIDGLLAKMAEAGEGHRFGLYLGDCFYLVELKKGVDLTKEIHEEMSAAWKQLDVSILHSLILDDLLGIGKEELEKETNVAYARDAEKAVAEVDSGKFQMAFFMNPTRASQVSEVAGSGERMPQKSTDFYPKILTGFVMNKLEIL